MGLIGASRPASGAEHMLSHYWEMEFIARKKYPELHGIKVGIATPIIAEIFEIMGDEIPDAAKKLAPSRGYVEGLLKTVGAPVSPKRSESTGICFIRVCLTDTKSETGTAS